jgi:integrase
MHPPPTSPTTCTTQTGWSQPCSTERLKIIQEAVGHRCDTSTAIYTHVSGDFMNTALRKALAPALGGQPG